MLDEKKIIEIAKSVATANLTSSGISAVLSNSEVNTEGEEDLVITIVITPAAQKHMKGETLLNTLVQIRDNLRDAGEDRFPVVQYATQEEIAESGGT